MSRGALTAADRRARAASGLTTRLLLAYVQREGAPDAVEHVIAAAGLHDRRDALRDESAWFSYDEKQAIFAACEEVLGDPRVAVKVGLASLELGVGDGLKRALRALGSPELVYRNVGRTNAKFNWSHQLSTLDTGRGHARVRYEDVCGAGYFRHDCDYTHGLLQTVPQLFGLPPGRVEHPVCGVQGDDYCEYVVTWSPGLQHIRRDATILTAGSTGLAVAGAFALPALLPAAAVVAAVGATALGVRTVNHLRGRVHTLEARVNEQDDATQRLFRSLGDLSADLRLDEVLDKIGRRASLAVGNKEYVLLLEHDGAMVADRHSGVPESSLRALERWATEHQPMLRDRPLMVDDVSSVPALTSLAAHARVPLGSLCAAPLLFGDQLLGALVALAHGSTVFLPHESASMAAYATQAAIALSNARLVERLERQAAEDPLTGLANQRAFARACEAEFSRAERDGGPVALVAIDLDHFKSINDVHGHPYGDEILRATADALRAAVRPHDTVGRMGGEEFALLLPRADADAAFEIAERARAAVTAVPVRDRTLSSSAGVASHPECGGPASELFRLADTALYQAKERGRARTVRHVAGTGGAVSRSEVQGALEPGGLEMVVQPIVALATGRVVCHEVLARFPGIPGRAIPEVFREAHRTGLGPQLEALAMRRALELPGRPPGTALSVNLSVPALCSAEVRDALPEDLTGLIIEVTEDEVFAGGQELEAAIARLRDAGAQIALDDAGAGYAGLQQVIRLRPDVVKLDRSLIEGVSSDPARAALVASFSAFAAQTGGSVCAEGLECPEDLRVIADLDVAYAQGYLLGRPSPAWAEPLCEAATASAAPLRGGMRTLAPASHARPGDVPATADTERLAAVLVGAADADRVDLWRLDRRTGDLVALLADGHRSGDRVSLSAWPARAHALAHGDAGQILRGDPDADPDERRELAARGEYGVLLVPLGDPGAVRGLIACYRRRPRPWSREVTNRVRALAAPLTARLHDESDATPLTDAA